MKIGENLWILTKWGGNMQSPLLAYWEWTPLGLQSDLLITKAISSTHRVVWCIKQELQWSIKSWSLSLHCYPILPMAWFVYHITRRALTSPWQFHTVPVTRSGVGREGWGWERGPSSGHYAPRHKAAGQEEADKRTLQTPRQPHLWETRRTVRAAFHSNRKVLLTERTS